jgi:hypothetical protein
VNVIEFAIGRIKTNGRFRTAIVSAKTTATASVAERLLPEFFRQNRTDSRRPLSGSNLRRFLSRPIKAEENSHGPFQIR